MKAYQLVCPACNATLDYDTDREFMFCKYCGNKIYIDNETKHIEVNANINYNKTINDEAKKAEAEVKKLALILNNRNSLISMIAAIILAIICFGMVFFLDFPRIHYEKPQENEIKITTSASEYKGENCEQIVKELEAAGFTNIETDPINDLVTGWVTKDGEIEKISIGGNSSFTSGEIFSKDSKVIITYHTFKEKN